MFLFVALNSSQLNLETEAKNLSKFNVLMNGYDNVKFPTPFYPYVTKTVLVETFEVRIPVFHHDL